MHSDLTLNEMKKEWHGSVKAYVIGFIASLILTALSFGLVISEAIPKDSLVYTLATLGLIQAVFQLLFFLHVGQEPKPRWETVIFCFMFLILLLITVGSLWIMNDLESRMMPDMNITDMTQMTNMDSND